MRYLIATAVLVAVVLVGWPAAGAPPSCAGLGGTVQAGQICHVHASGPKYMLDMTFPVDYPDQQALTDYITQNRDGLSTSRRGPRCETSPTKWTPPANSTAPASRRRPPAA